MQSVRLISNFIVEDTVKMDGVLCNEQKIETQEDCSGYENALMEMTREDKIK